MLFSLGLSALILPPMDSSGIDSSIAVTAAVAQQRVIDTLTGVAEAPPPEKRLKAIWVAPDSSEYDLGTIVGFTGGTSFSGTFGTITIAWPGEKNPRNSGTWASLLVAHDDARIKIIHVAPTSSDELEIPLLLGVPSPEGIAESYGSGRETIEIKIEDVTGVAGRMTSYSLPTIPSTNVDPRSVAGTVLGSIPYICLYETKLVSGCIDIFPNALMAADDVLITRQNKLNPLTGQKRIRYGDRDGRIVYRIVEDPQPGQAFNINYPTDLFDFTYKEKNLVAGMRIEPKYSRCAVNRVNPYIDLASRLKLIFQRGGVDEVVEVQEIGWRIMPVAEQMSFKVRRQNTN